MAKLVLTVTLSIPGDPEPGHPTRIGKALPEITKMIQQGARSGVLTKDYEYSQGGEPNRDIASIEWEIERQ